MKDPENLEEALKWIKKHQEKSNKHNIILAALILGVSVGLFGFLKTIMNFTFALLMPLLFFYILWFILFFV